MDKVTYKNKLMILLFGIVVGAGAILGGFALSHKSIEKSLKQEQAEHTVSQDKLKQAEEKIKLLKNQIEQKDRSLRENGPNSYQDLYGTAVKFFEIFYDYSQEKVTNKERQEKVEALCAHEVSEKMFPLEADKMKSDYGLVKSRLNRLEVYPTGLNGKQITALVDASYKVEAGEVSSTVKHYMWKVTFDSDTHRIDHVEDMGKLTQTAKNK